MQEASTHVSPAFDVFARLPKNCGGQWHEEMMKRSDAVKGAIAHLFAWMAETGYTGAAWRFDLDSNDRRHVSW